jgi:hypothetical protein
VGIAGSGFTRPVKSAAVPSNASVIPIAWSAAASEKAGGESLTFGSERAAPRVDQDLLGGAGPGGYSAAWRHSRILQGVTHRVALSICSLLQCA